jgi:hypothetical protein
VEVAPGLYAQDSPKSATLACSQPYHTTHHTTPHHTTPHSEQTNKPVNATHATETTTNRHTREDGHSHLAIGGQQYVLQL